MEESHEEIERLLSQNNQAGGSSRSRLLPWVVLLSSVCCVAAVALVVWNVDLSKHRESRLSHKQNNSNVIAPNNVIMPNINATTTTPNNTDATTPSNTNATTTATTPAYRPLNDLQRRQVDSYKNNAGLIVNIHVTHHAGTTFCGTIGRQKRTPSFVCMNVKPEDNVTDPLYPRRYPWRHQDTAKNIATTRQYFHMVSWEWSPTQLPNPPLSDTDWEDPNLVSVFITRDPISRLLAGKFPHDKLHKVGTHFYHPENERNKTEWWMLAKEPGWSENYALQKLTSQRSNTLNHTHLEQAKELLQRFTFVLDMHCLDEGLKAVADILGLQTPQLRPHRGHSKSPRQRIGHDDVYEYMVQQNQLTTELYEWSKRTLSLVQCSE